MAAPAPARLTRSRRRRLLRGIYVVLNDGPRALGHARSVMSAGIRIIQYRAKMEFETQRLRSLRNLTRQYDALLILNDYWAAAAAFDCDGVHLGPGDQGFTKVATIRAALPELLIGLSCGTLREVRRADADDADYLGIGSVFRTASKSDAGAPIGLPGLRRLVAATHHPVAAIGGINAANLATVQQTGIAMAAVISAVASTPRPFIEARRLIGIWTSASVRN